MKQVGKAKTLLGNTHKKRTGKLVEFANSDGFYIHLITNSASLRFLEGGPDGGFLQNDVSLMLLIARSVGPVAFFGGKNETSEILICLDPTSEGEFRDRMAFSVSPSALSETYRGKTYINISW